MKEEIQPEEVAGNLGRGKDINTIIKAADKDSDKEEAEKKCTEEDSLNSKGFESKNELNKHRPVLKFKNIRKRLKKRSRKLNCLDDNSQSDDDSDEDFRTSSMDNDEDESFSAASESSLELNSLSVRKYQRHAARERKKVKQFIVDDSEESEPITDLRRKEKKSKRIEDSDYSENDESEDNSETIDSEELCDDSTESEEKKSSWKSNVKKKRKEPTITDPKLKEKRVPKAIKLKKICDNQNDSNKKPSNFDNGDSFDVSRKTRGRRFTYLEDFDDDSSDGGIKPGVQRPDTPPEERAMFIKKQEEIKRMLAEKSLKNATTPCLSQINDNESVSGSLSTVPLSVIRQAKVLDIDYLQKRGDSNDGVNSDEFDDGLPEDFNPDDMDEEAIAKMMEEEDFATHQLKLAGEVIKQRKLQTQLLNESQKRKDIFAAIDAHGVIKNSKCKTEAVGSDDLSIKVIPTEILKPRMRRKKITPLRDALQKQQTAAAIISSTQGHDNSNTIKPESLPPTVDLPNPLYRGKYKSLINHYNQNRFLDRFDCLNIFYLLLFFFNENLEINIEIKFQSKQEKHIHSCYNL